MPFSSKPKKPFDPMSMTPQELDKHFAAMTPGELKAHWDTDLGPGLMRNRIASIGRGEKQIDFGQATVDAMRKDTKDTKDAK